MQKISIAFDELKLDADVDYAGVPLEMADIAPSPEELSTDAGIASLSTFLIRQYADRVRIKSRKGLNRVEIHLAH